MLCRLYDQMPPGESNVPYICAASLHLPPATDLPSPCWHWETRATPQYREATQPSAKRPPHPTGKAHDFWEMFCSSASAEA